MIAQTHLANHSNSEKWIAPVAKRHLAEHIAVSDLVYLYSECNKTRAQDHCLVVEVSGSFCNKRKFIGTQLCSTSYCVKTYDCYRVLSQVAEF